MNALELCDVVSHAAGLLQCAVSGAERVRGGGNNEIFRIESARGRFALKRYLASEGDRRDRIGHEYAALTLLARAGEPAVPQPIAVDRRARTAIYEWVAGAPPERLEPADIRAALGFLRRLHGYGEDASAQNIPPAAEACADPAALRTQIAARLETLLATAGGDARLNAFLRERFVPAWRQLEVRIGASPPVAPARQTLSPSDFGAHNMIRRPDGRLAFIDFEYFGWDDPVKLVADVIWHPGSALVADDAEGFRAGAQRIYGADSAYAPRFERLFPLYGLRWALIVLAEFIPERWRRRHLAGERADWDAVKTRQLDKAVAFVERSLREADSGARDVPIR